MIHTSCKNCIFADYNGKIQDGCHKSALAKYKQLGNKIIEVYDDDKEFFVIEKRKCIHYRPPSWIDFNYYSDEEYWQGIEYKLQTELQLQYTAIIYISPTQSFDDAKPTLLSLFNSIAPQSIVIVYQDNPIITSSHTKLPVITDDFIWCQNNLHGLTFHIEHPTQASSLHQALSLALHKVTTMSYLILEAGQTLNDTRLPLIYKRLFIDLYPLVAAKHSDDRYHELFTMTNFGSFVGNFGKKSVQEKINAIIEDAGDDIKCQQMFLIYDKI